MDIWAFEYQVIAWKILTQLNRYKREQNFFTGRQKISPSLGPDSCLDYTSILIHLLADISSI